MRYLACAVAAVALAGCATAVLNEEAIPQAASAQNLALDRCGERARTKEFTSMRGFMSCLVDARRQFAVDINLVKMELFTVYQDRAMLLAAQFDEGGVPLERFYERNDQILKDYTDALVATYRADVDKRQRQAAAIAAFGQSLQQAGAQYQANRPVNCTSTGFGNTVQTSCY